MTKPYVPFNNPHCQLTNYKNKGYVLLLFPCEILHSYYSSHNYVTFLKIIKIYTLNPKILCLNPKSML